MGDFWKNVTRSWQDSLTLLLGIYLFLSGWLLGYADVTAAFWNGIVFGAVLAVAGYLAITDFHPWEEWVDMAIGAWLVIAPWVLGFTALGNIEVAGLSTAACNSITVGVVIFALAAWSLRSHAMRHA